MVCMSVDRPDMKRQAPIIRDTAILSPVMHSESLINSGSFGTDTMHMHTCCNSSEY